MNQPGKENEDLEKWLAPLSPLELEEFCQRWIPIIYHVSASDPRYVGFSIELMAKLTDKTEKTVKNWFYRTQPVPDNLKKFLGAVDALWRISLLVDQIAARPQKSDD